MATKKLTAKRVNFTVHRGDTFNQTWSFDWDISGNTIKAEIVDENKQKVLDLTISSIQADGDKYIFTTSLTAEQADQIGAYNWYMVMIDGDDGSEDTLFNGEFSFIERPYEN